MLLLHDDACPHTAYGMVVLTEKFNLTLHLHPPYSLDLASVDNHLLLNLKTKFAGIKSKIELEDTFVVEYFQNLEANLYKEGISKLITDEINASKYINVIDDYVEK